MGQKQEVASDSEETKAREELAFLMMLFTSVEDFRSSVRMMPKYGWQQTCRRTWGLRE